MKCWCIIFRMHKLEMRVVLCFFHFSFVSESRMQSCRLQWKSPGSVLGGILPPHALRSIVFLVAFRPSARLTGDLTASQVPPVQPTLYSLTLQSHILMPMGNQGFCHLGLGVSWLQCQCGEDRLGSGHGSHPRKRFLCLQGRGLYLGPLVGDWDWKSCGQMGFISSDSLSETWDPSVAIGQSLSSALSFVKACHCSTGWSLFFRHWNQCLSCSPLEFIPSWIPPMKSLDMPRS